VKLFRLIFSIAFVLVFAACSNIPEMERDPILVDADYPPGMSEASFISHGDRLNALHYTANGVGPHPTVLLLHGYPGNEKNLDLAQSLRRAGWNVFFFHYRGAWGSEGDFSFVNSAEDISTALTHLREGNL
jgi:predicted alpha/beta-fold hydrolase